VSGVVWAKQGVKAEVLEGEYSAILNQVLKDIKNNFKNIKENFMFQ